MDNPGGGQSVREKRLVDNHESILLSYCTPLWTWHPTKCSTISATTISRIPEVKAFTIFILYYLCPVKLMMGISSKGQSQAIFHLGFIIASNSFFCSQKKNPGINTKVFEFLRGNSCVNYCLFVHLTPHSSMTCKVYRIDSPVSRALGRDNFEVCESLKNI